MRFGLVNPAGSSSPTKILVACALRAGWGANCTTAASVDVPLPGFDQKWQSAHKREDGIGGCLELHDK
jgi:hypothetical protein